jgi:uncharacterized protein (TIGR02266 family)
MLPDKESLEKRHAPRYLTRITIYYGGPFPEELLSDYSINVSTGGMFVESGMILPVDTVLTVRFNLPNSPVPIYTHVRVAWVNDPLALKKASLPPGMGLQFLTLSMEDMHTIRTFLDTGDFVPSW